MSSQIQLNASGGLQKYSIKVGKELLKVQRWEQTQLSKAFAMHKGGLGPFGCGRFLGCSNSLRVIERNGCTLKVAQV